MDQATIRKLFIYEPETGTLKRIGGRKDYPWHGCGKDRRYLAFSYGRKKIYLHQAVWLYHKGWLPCMLDHRDNDQSNCRIENLRPCTNAQNQYNAEKKINNRSGFKGVAFCKGYRKPWRARIIVEKTVIELGRYSTPERAAAAYAEGAQRYAGAFAR